MPSLRRLRAPVLLCLLVAVGVGFGLISQRSQAQFGQTSSLQRMISDVRSFANAGQYDRALSTGELLERYPLGEVGVVLSEILCDVHWKTGSPQEALERAVQTAALFPQDPQALFVAADYSIRLGRKNEGEEYLHQINKLAKDGTLDRKDPFVLLFLGKAALQLGADPARVLQGYLEPAIKAAPLYPDTWLTAGEVALDKRDFKRAAKFFQDASEEHGHHADVAFGLALSLGPSDPNAAEQALQHCLSIRPKHDGALLLLAGKKIEEEQYKEARALVQEVLEICPDHPKAWAHLAAIAHIRGEEPEAEKHRTKGLERYARNPEVDFTIGQLLARKYRFAPAAKFQERALELDPGFTEAKVELAQDLLRIGDEEAAWSLVKEIREEDPYSVIAFNLERLQRNIETFAELRNDYFVLRMPEREAQVYGQQALDLLSDAYHYLTEKYQYRPPRTTLVEFFPRQADFAVRTLGVPGGEGLLGACFGSVITMNSPGGLMAGQNNWEATLWHEMTHVITLGATKNRMPRWLSEGISVYEERVASPTWGQRMNMAYRAMILGYDPENSLVPLADLSSAFGGEVDIGFAYYQSSLVVEFIVENYGMEALLGVMKQLRDGKTDEEAMEGELAPLGELDEAFAEFARTQAEALGPDADWSEPTPFEMAEPAEALLSKPNSLPLLQQLCATLAATGQWADLVPVAEKLSLLVPEDVSEQGGYAFLAQAYRELGHPEEEKAVHLEITKRSPDALPSYLRLYELAWEAEDWEAVHLHGGQVISVNPMLSRLHFRRGLSQEQLEMNDDALASFQAWLALNPSDPAQAHYRIGRLLIGKDDASARRHLLDALMMAPRYREAHQALRQLTPASNQSTP